MSIRKSVISGDMWRYHILYYCDLVSLIRLSMTNRFLRHTMNEPRFVVDWQEHCWYMYRDCKCDRNLFYLDVNQYCDFLWEDAAISNDHDTHSGMFVIDHYLRNHGRSLVTLTNHTDPRPIRPPFFDPTNRPDHALGMCAVYLEELIIPVPRMLPVPVEYAATSVHGHVFQQYQYHPEVWGTATESLPVSQKGENESEAAFQHRIFWRGFHPIPYIIPDPQDHTKVKVLEAAPSSWPEYIESDRLKRYIEFRNAEHRDPFDPNDDDDCEGYHVAQWVRHKLYETGVGNQQYPLDLCLHRDEITTGLPRHRGVDYIDRTFVSLNKWDLDTSLYEHRGIVYTSSVRYNNEQGDFVPWALNSVALLHSMYMRLWIETMYRFTRQCYQFARSMATDVEGTIRATDMLAKFQEIDRVLVDGPIPAIDWLDGIHNIHRKLFLQQARYHTYIQLVRQRLEINESNRILHRIHDLNMEYLSPMIPFVDTTMIKGLIGMQGLTQMVLDVYRLLDVTAFVMDFANYMGPREHPITLSYRRSNMRVFLRWGMSLLMYNPGWRMDFDVKPSRADHYGSIRVPRVDLSHNHRFRDYMEFLNHRILYHQPEWNRGYLPQDRKEDLNHNRTGPV